MADANANTQPIIKKVKKVVGGGHHGGAWKVAYADFVTAMMAFFLLMWLLNATSEEQRKGIADFFSPSIPLSDQSAGGQGMLNGNSVFTSKDYTQANFGGSRDAYKNQKDDPEEDGDEDVEKGAPDQTGVEEPSERADADAADQAARAALSAEGIEGADEATREQVIQQAIETAFDALQQGDDRNELLDHLSIKVSPEGLMIEIAEREGAPLYNSGSATPSEKMRALIAVVAPILSGLDNDLAITGHTDATPFASNARYGNWELSSDRANSARRMLLDSGLSDGRIVRVSGAAATDPLTPEDRFAPQNRRIAITLLRQPEDERAP